MSTRTYDYHHRHETTNTELGHVYGDACKQTDSCVVLTRAGKQNSCDGLDLKLRSKLLKTLRHSVVLYRATRTVFDGVAARPTLHAGPRHGHAALFPSRYHHKLPRTHTPHIVICGQDLSTHTLESNFKWTSSFLALIKVEIMGASTHANVNL